MNRTVRFGLFALTSLLCVSLVSVAHADEKAKPATEQPKPETVKADAPSGGSSSAAAAPAASAPKSKYPPFADVVKDYKNIDGLIKLHQKDTRLLAELESGHFNRDFIVLTSIARGIGEGQLLGGMTWGFGDDSLWQFRKVEDNVQIVRRNVRFKASRGSPEEKAVKLAYTDSVLFALPIVTTNGGSVVVDLSQVFMSDLPQISHVLPGFAFSSSKSSWAAVKGFKDNVELEVAATYASSGTIELDTVPDSRGVSINIHYSISLLPETGYSPRQADDRVGYFLTAVKDFSKKGDQDRFERYINRWDLQKADPSAEISPPKKPIIFWIERTVPYQYRAAIRDGILEWNKAFEKAGFANAIEVRQQPDNADWDPEDINYNTFRWITAGAGFAMGPSRVNPISGQILDADIIFDADFVSYWKREYEMFTPQSIAALTGGPLDIASYVAEQEKIPASHRHSALCRCQLHNGMARELALASTALLAKSDAAMMAKEQDKLLLQGLKEVTMHEVGHTLGLRHNFKASTMLSLKDINNTDKTRQVGMLSSVMDYAPPNIVPKDAKQGDYYSTTLGPYDMWAIEFGYKPFSSGESDELKKIAARGAEQGLVYATDEDTRGIDPDPFTNRFDLGSDPLEYAKSRTKLIGELLPGIVEKVTKEGDGFQKARQAFGVLLGNYGQSVFMASRFVGGVEVHRDHKGDPKGRAPFIVISAQKQRDALKLVEDLALSDKPFNFPPELYNHLAATRWNHWGVNMPMRTDYAIHEVILMWQQRMIDQLTSSLVLERLHDTELRVDAKQDAFTTAELLSRLTASVFSEVNGLKSGDFSNRQPAISSLRRNLQRAYLKRLSNIALGTGGAPEDCQSVAYAELAVLEGKLKQVLADKTKLDAYTHAHLLESADRIHKVLDARLTFTRP